MRRQCSPETAQAIVDLLLQDASCGSVHGVQAKPGGLVNLTEPSNCRVCHKVMETSYCKDPLYCSKACHRAALEKRKSNKKTPKKFHEIWGSAPSNTPLEDAE